MNEKLILRRHNKRVYLEMIKDMANKKNGVYSFTLRLDNGNITDYVHLETVDVKKLV
jgi:hypothetical protein